MEVRWGHNALEMELQRLRGALCSWHLSQAPQKDQPGLLISDPCLQSQHLEVLINADGQKGLILQIVKVPFVLTHV